MAALPSFPRARRTDALHDLDRPPRGVWCAIGPGFDVSERSPELPERGYRAQAPRPGESSTLEAEGILP